MIELLFIAVVVFLIGVDYLFNYNEKAILLRKIPGFKHSFIIGNALEVIYPPVKLFELGRKIAKENNGIYRFWCFPLGAISIYNPEDIEIILSGMKYHQKSQVYSFLKPWLQDGLLLSYGEKWQDRRKILTPAFHFNILRRYYVNLQENTNRLVETLNKSLNNEIDLVPVISECTLNSICESAMGTRLSDESDGKQYKNAVYELGYLLVQRFIRIHLYVDFFFNTSSLGKKQKKSLSVVHNFTRKVINDRKKFITDNGINLVKAMGDKDNDESEMVYGKKKRTAMLDLLILAEQEGLMDNAGIQEEVDTFMFEGHDTTASGLTYCLMLLANYPEIQDNIIIELKDIFGETKRATRMEDLNAMRYLDRCIKESLRLYPPVPFISRQINEEVQLSNYTVPAGTFCHIHIYDLHRSEKLFPNPSVFDPDRFLPETWVSVTVTLTYLLAQDRGIVSGKNLQ
ncbi:unnamed protein product [Parnassius apollo]|uniref:(apollo) hypothetical protein n=1 Tax=Parnassius apollo TaxID=110799 RepID=A0A8S3WSE3_PARAO|nr:unnamed protein product [Parnassius apollo]